MKSVFLSLFLLPLAALADGPTDNVADNVRRQPPPGVPIPDDVRRTLTDEAARLGAAIEAARNELQGKPALTYLPDVQIFHKAVDWALRYDEFYNVKQTEWAAQQLKDGFSRLESLRKGETPWLTQTGLVPRGYLSKIDGSVQPFGVVVPQNFNAALPWEWDLNCWFHGRGETLTELDFIHQRQTNAGEFTPRDTIVLHPYGRYCNGQRFAGETDFFEALDAVMRDYRIDDERIVVRGFSLGGAACWHIATHHAWRWCAANPGAGFSETEQFLNFFQGEKLKPYPWERTLWNLYDSTAVAGNLYNCPTVAYSGEVDKQKQAADAMAAALKNEDMSLTHIIGPGTAHKYEPKAKAEVARRIKAITQFGRAAIGDNIHFQTFSLRYNKTRWVEVDGLEEHWKKAGIGAINGEDIEVHTENISAFTLHGDSWEGQFLAQRYGETTLNIDDQELAVEHPAETDGSWSASFIKRNDRWVEGKLEGVRKKHGLQGPIDDAFMDSFIFVRPTGQPANEKAGAWAKSEMERAIEHWRRQFRGDVRVKDDTAITDDDIHSAHLVLWGDPSSNAVMAKVAPKLPITWSATEIKAGAKSFPAAGHALICICPNPLDRERYVVLNSGFTFRDYDYLNNARQTPKLPDWAIIDLSTPPNSRYPGAIPAADFFDEQWELKR